MTRRPTSPWLLPALLGSAAALGASALYAASMTREAERRTPPIGAFITVDGVRLHYVERGRGEALVLIHGNGTMIQDFLSSSIVDDLAERFRVIVLDRPGYGYSDRPRGVWTPRAHATLYQKALRQLGVRQAVVLGHSWGALVAVALALQAPHLVRSLVLASGYYYPTLRADAALASPAAIPIIGDVLRRTVSPIIGRALLPAMIKGMFAPAAIPERFDREFPTDMMLRPLQLRASAEDAAMMTPVTVELQQHYRELELPVAIIAGGGDQIADVGRQSQRLHDELPNSTLIVVPGLGHMIHHLAPERVVEAVELASKQSRAAAA
ncbi:alpha/beta fold hydrolase [Methylobacterium gnaphalii]|uniref:Alpha/beta hydrolase n=1 Tax=Methylobacterium gnaphalii TaxID=1010610 RepID=A0A512JMN4_9HYPH|nr:alpha/beta hydrolase [Methylobacterium gnaphalii]GEP11235.1 alpha/beta hydrolase [Methylobacterium gnaphalii]GJD70105.1 Haloalkane dehalogenase 2 [Methylobacterium gnaphalii]GLS49740.1 alpha/beta hydrolase [Methylobacterium gnaphalii]